MASSSPKKDVDGYLFDEDDIQPKTNVNNSELTTEELPPLYDSTDELDSSLSSFEEEDLQNETTFHAPTTQTTTKKKKPQRKKEHKTKEEANDDSDDDDDEEWKALELEYEKQWTLLKQALMTLVLPMFAKLIGRRLGIHLFPKMIRSFWPVN